MSAIAKSWYLWQGTRCGGNEPDALRSECRRSSGSRSFTSTHPRRSLAIEGPAVHPRCALAQPNRLERFSALDIVRRYPPDLRDKSPALLRVSQAF